MQTFIDLGFGTDKIEGAGIGALTFEEKVNLIRSIWDCIQPPDSLPLVITESDLKCVLRKLLVCDIFACPDHPQGQVGS
jgi:hypothetical protein